MTLGNERDNLVYLAKLAEQAERFDEMARFRAASPPAAARRPPPPPRPPAAPCGPNGPAIGLAPRICDEGPVS